ncbi:D-glycerate dehydrogenase [Candidatus Woesearchaeota archaeon]|nr:D-glycerate dehydrogenase [Candidatus Woesearchaeota archaeon]
MPTKKKFKVFVTRKIPGVAIPLLKKHFEVKVYPKDEKISRAELLKGVQWCNALLCLLTEKIDVEVMDLNPHLKVISNYAVGYNNIDVAYATQKKIPVCNTPSQEVVDAVAEHTFALLFGIAKRIHEDEEYVREHKWKAWAPKLLLGTMVKGKTVGIVGLGKIGSGVAERLSCMGVKTIYYDVKPDKEFERKYHAQYVSLQTLLRTADFVTLHVPLLHSTRHLMNAKTLRLMKKTAYLINTSRGEVVDEKALIRTLQKKEIAGAGLDVYETEPKVNPQLTALHNCILTPHTASATVEVRLQMSKDAAQNIIAILLGKGKAKRVN